MSFYAYSPFAVIALLQICRDSREHYDCSGLLSAWVAAWQQLPLLRLQRCNIASFHRSSNAVLCGGTAVTGVEPFVIGGNVGLVFLCAPYANQYSNLNPNRDSNGHFAKDI
jgi:hypothetical protein